MDINDNSPKFLAENECENNGEYSSWGAISFKWG